MTDNPSTGQVDVRNTTDAKDTMAKQILAILFKTNIASIVKLFQRNAKNAELAPAISAFRTRAAAGRRVQAAEQDRRWSQEEQVHTSARRLRHIAWRRFARTD